MINMLIALVLSTSATESKLYADQPHWDHTYYTQEDVNEYPDIKQSFVGELWQSEYSQKYELSIHTDPYILVDYWIREPTEARNLSVYWTDDLLGQWIRIGTITPLEQNGQATLIIDRNHALRKKIRDSRSGFVQFASRSNKCVFRTEYIYEFSLHNF